MNELLKEINETVNTYIARVKAQYGIDCLGQVLEMSPAYDNDTNTNQFYLNGLLIGSEKDIETALTDIMIAKSKPFAEKAFVFLVNDGKETIQAYSVIKGKNRTEIFK